MTMSDGQHVIKWFLRIWIVFCSLHSLSCLFFTNSFSGAFITSS